MTPLQIAIAMVFDFDDTLTDDSATALVRSVEIATNDWTNQARTLLDAVWDPEYAKGANHLD